MKEDCHVTHSLCEGPEKVLVWSLSPVLPATLLVQ